MGPFARGVRGAVIAAACLAIVGCGQVPRVASRRGDGDAKALAPAQAADIQVALGRSLEAQGDFEKAMAAYREAARRDPKRADAPLRLAILLDRAGRFAESAPCYAAALKASPGDPEIFCDRGYSLGLQGRNAEAEAALRQALAKKPDLARAHNNLGLLLGRTNRPDEALDEFRRAGCREADARLNLAFALSLDHKWDEAKKHVAIARGLDPKRPEVGEGAAEIDALIAKAEGAGETDVDGGVLRAGGGASAGSPRE